MSWAAIAGVSRSRRAARFGKFVATAARNASARRVAVCAVIS